MDDKTIKMIIDALDFYKERGIFFNQNEAFKEIEEAKNKVEKLRWIPCIERLPDKSDIWDYYTPPKGLKRIDDVIAWMPLPEGYKEAE